MFILLIIQFNYKFLLSKKKTISFKIPVRLRSYVDLEHGVDCGVMLVLRPESETETEAMHIVFYHIIK